MHLTTLLAAGLAVLATALPSLSSPSTSKGFSLRVNLKDPSRDLNPTIQNHYLTDQRTGAGTAVSTFTSHASEAVWYQNGTTSPTVTHDIPGVYPLSLVIAGPETSDPFYPGEHAVGSAVSGGSALHAGTGRLSTLTSGSGDVYAVCQRPVLLGGVRAPIRTVRYFYSGEETVPDDCAPVEFIAECATLSDLPEGSSWDHDAAVEVPCSAKQ